LAEIKDPRVVSALQRSKKIVIARATYILIGWGAPGTEDALIWVLGVFGDKQIAVEFLNCGNPNLERAAQVWATGHGFRITPGVGGAVVWGSNH
jgi:hypothetical protein